MNKYEIMENQIQEEVETLREQFSHTRDLYREVCALLFFRYGITPTTNKLYRFVRKGSMSVPTEALSNFWKELREKSNTRIEHPDLPEDLGNMAGEVMVQIWSKAQLAAHDSLTTLRSEIESKVTQLLSDIDSIALERDNSALKLKAAEDKLNDQSLSLKELKEFQINLEDKRCLLEQQLNESSTKVEKLQRSIKEIKEHTENKLLVATRDINREQSRSESLETKLISSRSEYLNLQETNKLESNLLKNQLSDLREKIGEFNGRLQLTQSSNEQLNALLVIKEEKLKVLIAKIASSEALAERWSDRIHKKKTRRFVPSKRR